MTNRVVGREEVESFLVGVGQHLADATADALGERKTERQLRASADTAIAAYENSVAGLSQWMPAERPLDCRAGCTHCCHLTVLTDAATLFRIARYIDETFEDAARTRLKARIARWQALRDRLSQRERQRRRDPCP